LWAIGDAVPWRLSALVDPRGDANLIAWYVSVQLALLACGLALLACMQTDRRGPGWWCLVALPVVFGGLSFDGIAGVHEWLRERSDRQLLRLLGDGAPIFYTRSWLVVLAVPLVLLLIALGWGARRYLAGVRGRALLGLVLAIGSAVVLEPECIPFRGESYVLALAGAQLAQLVGITLLLWATGELLYVGALARPQSGAVRGFAPAAEGGAADRHRERAGRAGTCARRGGSRSARRAVICRPPAPGPRRSSARPHGALMRRHRRGRACSAGC